MIWQIEELETIDGALRAALRALWARAMYDVYAFMDDDDLESLRLEMGAWLANGRVAAAFARGLARSRSRPQQESVSKV